MKYKSTQPISECHKRACELVRHGYPAIPVGAGKEGKAPLISSWEEFQLIRKSGETGRLPTFKELDEWWQENPQAKVAAITGWHNLAVIDVDDSELAKKLIDKFKNHAPITQTPSGGCHIFVEEAEQSKSSPVIAGVLDVKGLGGYVLIHPSPGYEKVNDITAPLLIPVSARDYIADHLARLGYEIERKNIEKNQATRTTKGTSKLISEGNRNAVLASYAGSLRQNQNGLDEKGILAALQGINQELCIPPLQDNEIVSIARSISSYEATTREWEPLTAFHEYKLPVFPLSTLPDDLRQWVEATAESTQTPPDLAALLALSAISATCQRKIEVEVRADYVEPLSVYTVTALEPGNRKSAVFRTASKPIYEYEISIDSEMKDEIAASQNEYEIIKKRVKKAQDEAAKADEDYEEKKQRANTLAVEFTKMRPLVAPRYIVDDATTEKLVSLLAEHDERISMLSAEGDIFSVMAGRYSSGGEPNFGIYLKGHVGDPHRFDRVSGRTGYLQRPALTMALTVQLGVLRELSRTPQFSERGLVARIWFAIPNSPVGSRQTITKSVPSHITQSYHDLLLRLLKQPATRDMETGKIIPHYLQLSPEARAVFADYSAKVEPKLAPYGEYSDIINWSSKLVGSVVRLAGLLHLAAHNKHSSPWKVSINAETFGRAIHIGNYLVSHAKAAHGLMKTDPVVEDAKYLVGWLARINQNQLTKRELYRATRGKLKTVSDLDPPLNLLIEHGYIREVPIPRILRTGRNPSPTYEVNPKIIQTDGHNGQKAEPQRSSDHSDHQKLNEKEPEEDVPAQQPTNRKQAQDTLFFDFPLYNKEHRHEFTMVNNVIGTFYRCKQCGEFPPKETKKK